MDNEMRNHAGIESDNGYVFAVGRGSQRYIRGYDVLRRFSSECKAENPLNLRSTNLRKQVATMSQLLNLQNHELDQLAKFMGHNINVHREFYRLPHDVMQTAKVVKILMAMEKGCIQDFQGKSLDKIQVDVNADNGNTFFVLLDV